MQSDVQNSAREMYALCAVPLHYSIDGFCGPGIGDFKAYVGNDKHCRQIKADGIVKVSVVILKNVNTFPNEDLFSTLTSVMVAVTKLCSHPK